MSKQIIETLNQIEGNGSFVFSGAADFMPLGLHIKGVNEIGFPIPSYQIPSLIKVAHKAPFGKGSQTILDTTVRSAWEIDAQNVSFLNPNWAKTVESILEKVKWGLGVEQHDVTASLYKLLIYEAGDFFLPHKDSEKEAGMFGTFIIGLPSKHTGGELFVRFDGHEEVIDFSASDNDYKLPYAAFYADCEHEIKPVTSGYRVCLVYNLVQKPNGKKIELNATSQYTDILVTLLQEAYQEKPLVILLGHEYTPTNFSLATLKSNDYPRAEILFEAAEKAGFYAKLALLTCYMSGDLQPTQYAYGRRGRRYYDDDDDATDGVMGDDIYEQNVQIEHWSKGEPLPPLSRLKIKEENVITDLELWDGEPTEKQAEGYTGNAGMTMEYWYHYGAVVLWHKNQHADLLKEQGIETQLAWLQYFANNWQPTESDGIKNLLLSFTEDDLKESYRPTDFSPVAAVLIKMNDVDFISSASCQVLLAKVFSRIDIAHWVALFNVFGTPLFKAIFKESAKSHKIENLYHITNILLHIIGLDKFDTFLTEQIKELPTYLSGIELAKEQEEKVVKTIFANVLGLSKVKNEDKTWLQETTDGFVKSLTRAYVNDVLVATLLNTPSCATLNLAKQVAKVCQQDLIERTALKPTPPLNWAREVPKDTAYYKAIWAILTPFLQSTTQQVFDYARPQSARNDMESAIRNVAIDLKMETIKKGSPHTLRLTKTQVAYEKLLAKWHIDKGLLSKIDVF